MGWPRQFRRYHVSLTRCGVSDRIPASLLYPERWKDYAVAPVDGKSVRKPSKRSGTIKNSAFF